MRKSTEEWEVIIERYRASGQSVRRFCGMAGISEPGLRYQIKKLEGKERLLETEAAGFVEIRKPGMDSPTGGQSRSPAYRAGQVGGFSIRFGKDAIIEVYPDTDRQTLEWVLTLMMGLV